MNAFFVIPSEVEESLESLFDQAIEGED